MLSGWMFHGMNYIEKILLNGGILSFTIYLAQKMSVCHARSNDSHKNYLHGNRSQAQCSA